ncbi:type II toxin-antitoxin system mRNA interferase toxin, RelE/StbE family [Patescibacteria group bacterium AH-259-L05]|nr:type II toxin-antitoxin system mRNA interferase toxin, RelE/StbE family [Patescibacteria group bacterium AH-259-L05]
MKINLSPRFKRSYQRLSPHLREDFDEKIIIFAKNPYHPTLKTHKLKGRLQECLAFYLKDGYRVLFEFSGTNTVDLLEVGPHGIYKRFRR